MLVHPGDFVVADGDGVIVVPAEHLETVARLAIEEHQADQEARRQWYEQLGLPGDASLH